MSIIEISLIRKVMEMPKWKVKGCPRCGGDMFLDRDLDSWYEQCLQCSYRAELKPLRTVKEPVTAGGKATKKQLEAREPQEAA